MPKQPSPERQEGRALFLDAIAPLRTAQQLGYRQGLEKAVELARKYPNWPAYQVAVEIESYLAALPETPG